MQMWLQQFHAQQKGTAMPPKLPTAALMTLKKAAEDQTLRLRRGQRSKAVCWLIMMQMMAVHCLMH